MLRPPLDPITAMAFAGFFIVVVLLTMRRPLYGAAILIVVQPFALYGDVLSTTATVPKIVLLAVLLGLWPHRGAFAVLRLPVPKRLLVAGLLVLAATLFSLWHAAHHEPVLRESLKAFEYLLLFCAVAASYRLDPDRAMVRTAAFGVTIAVALLALSQELLGAPSVLLLNGHLTPRIAGPLEGPNQLAGYFDVGLPLVFALAIDEPTALAHVALLFAVFADVLTFSRGGALGGVAGLLTVGIILRKHLRETVVFLFAGLIGGAIVALSWGIVAHSLGIFRLWSFNGSETGGVGTRPELWRAATQLWWRHPFFGVGAGNFELEIPLTGLRGVHTHANSLYLQSLAEGGIPLFAATLWLVYTSIAAFARKLAQSPLITAAFGASIALALHQTVDFLTFYPKVGGWWWIVMALGAACAA